MGTQNLMGGLQSSDRLFARNRGEGVEKFVEAMAALQIIDEISKWHARPNKNRSAAKYFGITVYD